jgi:hypothetical protein
MNRAALSFNSRCLPNQQLCPRGLTRGAMTDGLIAWFFERKIECPGEDELTRLSDSEPVVPQACGQ